MLQSAVSSGLLLAVTLSGQQLTQSELIAYRQNIEPSLVMVMQNGFAKAPAVLIDSRGYFLVHRDAVTPGVMFGKLSSGQIIQLNMVARDDVTQLALIKSDGWTPVGRTPVTVVRPNSFPLQKVSDKKAVRLIAALATGPIRVDLVDTSKVGVLRESNRAMTLSEIRFENPASMIGGGMLFTAEGGQLAGVLGAALDSVNDTVSQGFGGGTGAGGGADMATKSTTGLTFQPKVMGPADLTVAYSISPDIVDRVVQGFLSPEHKVAHPALGIVCIKDASLGALVTVVNRGSAAEAGGIKVGDVIVWMDGTDIKDQKEYARTILRQTIGSTVPLKVRRGKDVLTLSVRVGQ